MCGGGCLCQDDDDDLPDIPAKQKPKKPSCKVQSCFKKDDNDGSSPWIAISEDTRKQADEKLVVEWKKKFPFPIYTKALKILRDLEEEDFPQKSCKPVQEFSKMSFPQTIPCFMASPVQPTSDMRNEEEYPLLIPYITSHGVPLRPMIKSKTVRADGSMEPISQSEEVLNWQTHSHLAQQRHLKRHGEKLDKILDVVEKQGSRLKHVSKGIIDLYEKLEIKISKLEKSLYKMVMEKRFLWKIL